MPSSTLGPRGPNEWQSGDTLLAPMLTRDSRLLGIIDAYDPRDRCAPTPDSVRVLELFANLAAVAIENALQYEALESQGEHLAREIHAHENLLAVSESMLTTLDQQVVFNAIDDQLRLLIDYDTLCIDRVDWPTHTMKPIYVRDETYGDAILGMAVAVGEGLCGWVAEHDEAILVNDVLTDARGTHIPGTVDGEPQASIVVPLTVQARVLGVLTIDRLGGKSFSEEDFDLVKVFASQAAIAIQNADLYEEIQRRAITDSLTGLYNHGHFEETLAHEITRERALRRALLAHHARSRQFQAGQRRFGHPIGDRVLRRVADALLECSREADYVARYGGEEFIILLPGTRREDACRLAERIRKRRAPDRRRHQAAATTWPLPSASPTTRPAPATRPPSWRPPTAPLCGRSATVAIASTTSAPWRRPAERFSATHHVHLGAAAPPIALAKPRRAARGVPPRPPAAFARILAAGYDYEPGARPEYTPQWRLSQCC